MRSGGIDDSTDCNGAPNTGVFERLSLLDRFLPLWIIAAMALGVILGAIAPGIKDVFNALSIGAVSFPIAVGLLWMMYPVLAKVKYEELGKVAQAALLAKVEIQLNVVIGLCVGYDSLFFMHSKAPATVLVAKDRVLGHNPAAALYTSRSCYRRLTRGGR